MNIFIISYESGDIMETNLDKKLIGNIYTNNDGFDFKVIKFHHKNKYSVRYYECSFLQSGYCGIYRSDHILSGNIKDPYSPIVCDVGCIGLSSKKDNYNEYQLWRGMLLRCYDKNSISYNNYGGSGVTVCERWLCFEYFLQDLPLIDGFDYYKFHNKELHLDKDLKQRYSISKVYSLDTCVFLPRSINIGMFQNIQCVAISDNDIIRCNSYTEMANELNASESQISITTTSSNRTCHGYKILKIPAMVVPATIII